jgi:sugar phosphate isomerase/epimerase
MAGRTSGLSLSTVVFDGYGLAVAVAEAAALGFSRIEPAYIAGYLDFDETAFSDSAAADLRNLMRAAGLAPQAVSAHMDLGLPGATAMLARRIRFAAGVGAPVLITNSSTVEHEAAALAAIEAALPVAADAGVVIALENPGHGTGSLIPTGRAAAALLARFASPHLRLNWDAGNVVTYNCGTVDPLADLAMAMPFLAHLHLKDVAEDGPDWRFCSIGDGMVRCRDALAAAPGIPAGLELPLRLWRPGRGDPQRRRERLPLPLVRDAIARSLQALA